MAIRRTLSVMLMLLSLFCVSAVSVSAATVVRTGDLVSITDEQVVEGDFYTAGRKVNISGEATEDVVAAAQEITINGTIGDNAFFFADEVDVFGTVGDDLRVIARNVTIAEPVMGDVFVVAGTVRIPSTASIAGDVLVYAQEVIIEGSIGGRILGTADTVRVDGAVAGDIDITVGQLTLGDRAVVEGAVSYESNELIIRAPNASIAGDLVRSDPVLPGNEASVRLALVPTMVLLFSVLVWYLVARKSLRATVAHALTKSPRPFFVGLLLLLLMPIASVILIASVLGSLVGIAVLLLYVLLCVAGVVCAAAIVGQLAMLAVDHEAGPPGLVALCIGVVVMTILMLLPYIGQFIFVLLLILAVGAMGDLLFRSQH